MSVLPVCHFVLREGGVAHHSPVPPPCYLFKTLHTFLLTAHLPPSYNHAYGIKKLVIYPCLPDWPLTTQMCLSPQKRRIQDCFEAFFYDILCELVFCCFSSSSVLPAHLALSQLPSPLTATKIRFDNKMFKNLGGKNLLRLNNSTYILSLKLSIEQVQYPQNFTYFLCKVWSFLLWSSWQIL